MSKHSSVQTAIVLCAGRGKRLSPHTDTIPKPLLPVDGKPTLDFILSALQRANIKRVVLVTHYLGELVQDYATHQSFYDSSNIVCVKQSQLAGTADATTAALQAKPDWVDETFLLTASDYLVPPSFYQVLLQAHIQSNKAITVSLKRIDESELAMRSSARFDDNGDVLEVVEKPAPGCAPSALSANLVFVLPPDIAQAIAEVEPSPRGEKEIQSAVNSYLRQHGPGCGLEQVAPQEWNERSN